MLPRFPRGGFVRPVFRIVPFVLAFSATIPAAGTAKAVLWFEPEHETGRLRGVEGAVDDFFAADNQNDIDRLELLFEEEGVWLPPTGEVVTGRRAIAAWYRARHVRWTPALSAALVDLRVDKTTAVVHGAARGSLVPACGGAAVAVDDRFVMILSLDRQNAWKVTRLLWRRGASSG